MTAPSIIDPARFLHEHLEQAARDAGDIQRSVCLAPW